MKEWMTQADPRKEASTVKKCTTLKNGRLQVVLWKDIMSLQKLDASNRSS